MPPKTSDKILLGKKLKKSLCGLCYSGIPFVKPELYHGTPDVYCKKCGVLYTCAECGKKGGTYSAIEYDSYCEICIKN